MGSAQTRTAPMKVVRGGPLESRRSRTAPGRRRQEGGTALRWRVSRWRAWKPSGDTAMSLGIPRRRGEPSEVELQPQAVLGRRRGIVKRRVVLDTRYVLLIRNVGAPEHR